MPQTEVIFLQKSDPHVFPISVESHHLPWSSGGTPQSNLHALPFSHPMVLPLPKRLFNLSPFSSPTVIACPLGCLHGLLIDHCTSGLCSPLPVYTLPLACFVPLIPLHREHKPCGPDQFPLPPLPSTHTTYQLVSVEPQICCEHSLLCPLADAFFALGVSFLLVTLYETLPDPFSPDHISVMTRHLPHVTFVHLPNHVLAGLCAHWDVYHIFLSSLSQSEHRCTWAVGNSNSCILLCSMQWL